jgi:hypothetical protein
MDSESDAELSPEIKLKSRKRVLPPVTRPLQDSSHTFLLNTTSPVGKEGTFCRSSYVQNIFSHDDVLCCVLSTFTLDFPYLIDELPCILSPSASVECMLVHGRLSNQSKLGLRGGSLKYSSKLRLVEVSPQHKRTSHMGFVQHATHIMGVHHPKYLLIFVTLGVHVIISSSNLTPSQNSTDITWSQFFPVQPFTLDRQPVPGSEGGRGRAHGTDTGNDFGAVLEDFLKQVRGHHQLIADVHASLCDGVVMVNGVCVWQESAQVRPSSLLPPGKGPLSAQGPMEFIWHHLRPLHKGSRKVTFSTLFAFQDAKVPHSLTLTRPDPSNPSCYVLFVE